MCFEDFLFTATGSHFMPTVIRILNQLLCFQKATERMLIYISNALHIQSVFSEGTNMNNVSLPKVDGLF